MYFYNKLTYLLVQFSLMYKNVADRMQPYNLKHKTAVCESFVLSHLYFTSFISFVSLLQHLCCISLCDCRLLSNATPHTYIEWMLILLYGGAVVGHWTNEIKAIDSIHCQCIVTQLPLAHVPTSAKQ